MTGWCWLSNYIAQRNNLQNIKEKMYAEKEKFVCKTVPLVPHDLGNGEILQLYIISFLKNGISTLIILQSCDL